MTQTILLTGISGFIAKRIARDLLARGHAVRGSLRTMDREDEVRAAVGPDGQDRLSFVELDLTRDDGWDAAMEGADTLVHTASPFPMGEPKEASELIRPAVDGTRRAMQAAQAAGVTRVVLTASMASIVYSARPQGYRYGPGDWTDVTWPGASAYIRSKTLAERAARDFAEAHPEMRLTTIHPGLVCGEPVDGRFGTSLNVIRRMLSGRDPAQPDICMPVVDLADVSALHVAAVENAETAGQRLIAAAGVMTFPEIAATLAAAFPERRIASRVAPKWLLWMLSFTDSAVRGIHPLAGIRFEIDNGASLPLLESGFVPAPEAVRRSGAFLLRARAG